MEVNVFHSILHFINTYKGLSRDCLTEMIRIYPNIPVNTLASILSTKYQKKMMTNHGKVKHNKQDVIKRYREGIEAGEEPGLIIRLARFYDVAPALIGKVILEETCEKRTSKKGEKDNLSGASKNMIKDMFKDTTQIQDPDLAYEIFLSIVFDNMYGPISDVTKHSLGSEYEARLEREVARVGLSYRTEEQLRARGYDKTPDVKLETPCAVDGFIISWVESKAVFGDRATHDQYARDQYLRYWNSFATHDQYARDQYLRYWNRFGPGLVIYWFGYVETVIDPNEKRFIVRDKFPENLTLMDPSLIQVPTLKIS